MKSIRVIFLAIGLLGFIPTVVNAATYSGNLVRMTNEWGGGAYILELQGVSSPCSQGGYYIQTTNSQYKEIVATAMLAFSLGKRVDLTTDAAQTCVNGRVVLVAIQINN